jgi:hypothetical protein
LVVDGEWEEVASRICSLSPDSSHQNDSVGHVDQNRTVRLSRDGAGLDRNFVLPVLKSLLDRLHWISLMNDVFAGRQSIPLGVDMPGGQCPYMACSMPFPSAGVASTTVADV